MCTPGKPKLAAVVGVWFLVGGGLSGCGEVAGRGNAPEPPLPLPLPAEQVPPTPEPETDISFDEIGPPVPADEAETPAMAEDRGMGRRLAPVFDTGGISMKNLPEPADDPQDAVVPAETVEDDTQPKNSDPEDPKPTKAAIPRNAGPANGEPAKAVNPDPPMMAEVPEAQLKPAAAPTHAALAALAGGGFSPATALHSENTPPNSSTWLPATPGPVISGSSGTGSEVTLLSDARINGVSLFQTEIFGAALDGSGADFDLTGYGGWIDGAMAFIAYRGQRQLCGGVGGLLPVCTQQKIVFAHAFGTAWTGPVRDVLTFEGKMFGFDTEASSVMFGRRVGGDASIELHPTSGDFPVMDVYFTNMRYGSGGKAAGGSLTWYDVRGEAPAGIASPAYRQNGLEAGIYGAEGPQAVGGTFERESIAGAFGAGFAH